ncbi:uro-adherence factor A-like, partial [Saccostrea cucullata]|uniref:uro-adherence factor A-like n=1 Tax=Saccostrea cuccullata TaxID=36930 RepID=UPI002ED34758
CNSIFSTATPPTSLSTTLSVSSSTGASISLASGVSPTSESLSSSTSESLSSSESSSTSESLSLSESSSTSESLSLSESSSASKSLSASESSSTSESLSSSESSSTSESLSSSESSSTSESLPSSQSSSTSESLSSSQSSPTSSPQTSASMIKAPKHCRVNGTHGNYSCNIGPQGMLHVSESLTCECNTGFHLKSGDLERTCLHGGTWSGSEPMCIASGSCMCPCDRVTNPSYTSPNDEALLKEIQRMKQELLILKNITNKALRKKISIPDFRPSANVSGTPWVLLLVAMVLWIVVPDVWTVIQQLKILIFRARI